MKKVIATSVLALATAVSFGAATVVSTGSTITNTNCTYIPASNTTGVKLTTSANVAAAYECTSTGVVTGAAHTQGKKNAYVSTSAGGSQTQATLSANPSATTTDITTLMTGGVWSGLVAALT